MEQSKKQLKTLSIVVLIFAGLSLLQIILELLFGDLNSAQIPAGSPDNILLITKMILLVMTLLFLLPKFYVGIKGLRIAKKPNSSKGHIVWAMIIFAFSVLSLIEPAVALVKPGSLSGDLSTFCILLVEAVIYFEYIISARAVAKLAD